MAGGTRAGRRSAARGLSRFPRRAGGPWAGLRRAGPAACGKEVYLVLRAELPARGSPLCRAPPKRSHSTWARAGEWGAFRGSELPEDGDLCRGAGARHAGVAAGAESALCCWLLPRHSAGGPRTVLGSGYPSLSPHLFSKYMHPTPRPREIFTLGVRPLRIVVRRASRNREGLFPGLGGGGSLARGEPPSRNRDTRFLGWRRQLRGPDGNEQV